MNLYKGNSYFCDMTVDYTIRNLQESDYKTMLSWWKYHRFPPPPRFILPDKLSDGGLMVLYKGEELCSGILYSTSSSNMFHLEWLVSTFEIKNKKVRKTGINFLINGLIYVAKQKGAKVIYTSLVNQSLIERYRDCGFQEGSKGCLEMIKIL